MELGCRLLIGVDQRLRLRLGLVEEQQQMKLQVAAEDLLSRLLVKLDHHRQAVLREERTQ